MTPQQANELLPCAHCNSQKLHETSNGEDSMFIACADCGASGPAATNRAAMFAAWNRRAPAPAEPAVDRDAVLKLKRWTFDGGMSAAIRADGQWVYFDDVLRLAAPQLPQASQPTSAEGKDGDNQSQEQSK